MQIEFVHLLFFINKINFGINSKCFYYSKYFIIHKINLPKLIWFYFNNYYKQQAPNYKINYLILEIVILIIFFIT